MQQHAHSGPEHSAPEHSGPDDRPVAACRHCGQPVALDEDHVTLALQVERDIPGALVIGESRVVAYFHLGCVRRDPAGELVEPARSA